MASGGDRKIGRNKNKCNAYKLGQVRERNKFLKLIKHLNKRVIRIWIKVMPQQLGHTVTQRRVEERLRHERAAISRLLQVLPSSFTKPHLRVFSESYGLTF